MIHPRRLQRLNPAAIMERYDIRSGWRVLDAGCGSGFWTKELVRRVGESGMVAALDLQMPMLELMRGHVNAPNVRPVICRLPEIPLAASCVHMVWAAFVVHELEHIERFLEECRRILLPGGILVVVEWRDDGNTSEGPPRHKRIPPDRTIRSMRWCGLENPRIDWTDEDYYSVIAIG